MSSLPTKPRLFAEPFAGGGIISLTVAREDLASRVLMVEIDRTVAAVWETMLSNSVNGLWLADKVRTFRFTRRSVKLEVARIGLRGRDLAFQTILRNRVNHGGKLEARAGQIREGEHNNGLKSRWYPETLQNRIIAIAAMRDRIKFVRGNAFDVLLANRRGQNTAWFLDPPYILAGGRMYTHSEIDHERLFSFAAALQGDFLMTYDDSPEIRRLVRKQDFQMRRAKMRSTHHHEITELLISRNMRWFRRPRR